MKDQRYQAVMEESSIQCEYEDETGCVPPPGASVLSEILTQLIMIRVHIRDDSADLTALADSLWGPIPSTRGAEDIAKSTSMPMVDRLFSALGDVKNELDELDAGIKRLRRLA